MCGICGEFRFDGEFPALETIQSMLPSLAKRGPDDEGMYSEGPLAFGHRRLSVIDLSRDAHQPMVDAIDGLALVFNGAIYNYPELRQQLIEMGRRFHSHGDTEVILKAYAQWGEDCVTRLQGMFAFAIWDMRQQKLFIARDRLGIKPFYFTHGATHFRFASNTQALLAAGEVDTSLDHVALHHLFTLHAVVPAPRTILRGIRKLAPGHTLSINAQGQIKEKPYWQLAARRPDYAMDEVEWQQAIHDALRKSVARRLKIADVPVGVLLSGGLDSSLLVALLAEQGVSDLKTFTVGFDDHPDEAGSEFKYSDPVAQRYATEHYKFHVPNSQVLARLPEAVSAMAEPMFAQDAVAFYLLSEQVSQQVKVVQSGQGADEVFAGYFWYPRMKAASGDYLQRFAPHYFDRDHDELAAMLNAMYVEQDFTSPLIRERLESAQADSFIDAVLQTDVTTLIVDDPVKRVDNMTMAWGLEARVPFLDHELVELAASMPPEYKLAENGKGVLKKIARELLPASVIDRKKGYFPVPALKYIRGEIFDFVRDILHSPEARARGLYQPAYVEKLLANPEGFHTRIEGNKLWHLALLEFWLQRHNI